MCISIKKSIMGGVNFLMSTEAQMISDDPIMLPRKTLRSFALGKSQRKGHSLILGECHSGQLKWLLEGGRRGGKVAQMDLAQLVVLSCSGL